jgi:hypothetical protein
MRTKLCSSFIVICGFIFWSFFTPKSVSATCTGTIICGHVSCSSWQCSDPNFSCSQTGAPCGFGGTCQCTSTGNCVGDQNPVACTCSSTQCGTCANCCVSSSSCRKTDPVPGCPNYSSCGTVNCDTCTQHCCWDGCQPIGESCAGHGGDGGDGGGGGGNPPPCDSTPSAPTLLSPSNCSSPIFRPLAPRFWWGENGGGWEGAGRRSS